jgi:hypothetical protein
MFKRKKTETDQPVTASAPAPVDAAGEPRTTCYPQDAEAPPAVVGQPRTTVYRQSVRWNRGGYDTTN